MSANTKSQQIEFEVFPKDNKTNYSYLSGIKGDTNPESSSINVVFSTQSAVIIFICVVMSLVASFTLGVEKGKLIAKNSLPPQKLIAPVVQAAPQPTQETPKITTPLPPAVKTAQESPLVPPAQPSLKGYTIQVASVKSAASAESLAGNLTKTGVSSFTKSSGKYIVVLAGNFEKKEDAQIKLRELKKTYADCFIKKI